MLPHLVKTPDCSTLNSLTPSEPRDVAHNWDDELGFRKWIGESSNRSRTNNLDELRLWGDEVE